MCIILFLMIIILSFQSHQICMLSAGLGMAWNRYGLSCIDFYVHLLCVFQLKETNFHFVYLITAITQCESLININKKTETIASKNNETSGFKHPFYTLLFAASVLFHFPQINIIVLLKFQHFRVLMYGEALIPQFQTLGQTLESC